MILLINLELMKIQIINKSSNELPSYSTCMSAGMDVRSNVDKTVPAQGAALIPTGLYMALPEGYECQVRPRSGLALKRGITVLNSPGTVDADYRGEIGVILYNTTNEPFVVKVGERIAQIVISKYETAEWDEVDILDSTSRGSGGFGHSGLN